MPYGLTVVLHGDGSILIYQICHKAGHNVDACWYRYIENYVPQVLRHLNRGRGPRFAYMASFKLYFRYALPFKDSYANLFKPSVTFNA